MPLTFGRRAQRKAATLLTELDTDDPFIAVIAPGERVWTGVSAIHWTMRSTPGMPREATERQLVLTSNRLLTIGPLALLLVEPDADEADVFETPYEALGLADPRNGDGTRVGFRQYPYARMSRIHFRKLGAQGFVGFAFRGSDGAAHDVEFSTARAIAKVLVARMQELHEHAQKAE